MSGKRELPAHIQAQLASAGRETDTGGQAWEGRNLGEGTSHTHQFPDDDGTTPEALADALARFVRGESTEHGVIEALRGVRLFAPVVAELSHAEITEQGLVSDKESDMALVSIQAPDGRKALPVFSSVDALTSWHPEARPVAATARKIALSAVEDENQLMVLNPGAEPTFVVRRPALWALAKDEPWTPSYEDPGLVAVLREQASGVPEIRAVDAGVGRGVASRSADGRILAGGGPGPELEILVDLEPGLDQAGLQRAVGSFQERLGADPRIAERVDSLELKLRAAR